MTIYIYWFLLALVLLGLEMATGTFYLLILAIAMAVGGFLAFIGLAFTAQLTLAALASIVGIMYLYRWKSDHQAEANPFNLDVGQSVEVLAWKEDGTARVFYRGTEWNAEPESQEMNHKDIFYIKDVRGSVLVITNKKPL
ncbi:NfeD family protein [Legionella worsleiensis]|uniref:NfeD-like C-terminal domain-containing protein n=1 Tax=Legionella worsleiensis TaxID=45076 RepID=A0A0W1AF90_9GAMM|nr:NfeD family protein [Legionella worsleiensis]KTD79966.1 hypothetical protein Lwor_1480 [Legionella worsleiensis]STY32437.1 NfeD-like C-terminal, partner-binding [Legionella worsleiensis]